MTKMGFYFDQTRCMGCRTCQIACKDKNDLPIGVLFRRVSTFETGHYPNASVYHLSQTCNHCASPACVIACPSGAMYKDSEDGTVLHDDDRCIACKYCESACPYGNPVFIPELHVVHKCDGCKPLRDAGERPACVASCIMRAISFGPYETLLAEHPDSVRDIAILPDSSQTDPCVAIDCKKSALEPEYVQKRI